MPTLRLSLQQPFELSSPFKTGLAYGLISAFCFGLMTLFIQSGAAYLPNTQLLFCRALLSFSVILPSCWRELPQLIKPSAYLLWCRALFAGVSVRVLFFNCSTIGAGNATLLLDSAMVFMVLMAWLFLKERIRSIEWACIALVLGGSVLLSLPSVGQPIALWQVGLGLGGAFSAAISFLMLKQVSGQYSPGVILLVYTVVLMVASLLPPQPGPWLLPEGTTALLVMGVGLASLLNQLYLTKSYSLCKASIAGMIALTGVLWATLFEALAFNQWPTGPEWLAVAIMLGGVGLLKWVRAEN